MRIRSMPASVKREAFLTIIGITFTVLFLFPVYWILISSFKTDVEIFTKPATLWPKQFTFDNYATILLQRDNVARSFLNSLLTAVPSAILSGLLALPAAYSLARFQMRLKKAALLMFLLTQMMPVTLTLTPLFIMYQKLNLINNLWSVILSCAAGSIPFSVMIMRTYFLGVPKELEEAAIIDGCGRFQAFLRILIPVAFPGVATVVLIAFIGGWNNLIYPMTFITNSSYWPATAGLYTFNNEYGLKWNMVMTYSMLVITPLLILFVFLQKYMVAGFTDGAVKG